MKKVKLFIFGIVLFALSLWLFVAYSYTQKYVQDSNETASTGIFVKNQLQLSSYKLISKGNDMWGKYDSYSRSDRHDENIRVYCDSFCKK